VRVLILLALFSLAACGSRSTWEPENEDVARYGSGTDEALLADSMQGAVGEILATHPPSPEKAVSIRVPRDPDSYCAAALLMDGLERAGTTVAWIPFEGVAAPSTASVEIWEVATTLRGATTFAAQGQKPDCRRVALVEVRVSALAADQKLLWDARSRWGASCLVNVHFAERKTIPDAH